MSMEKPKDEEKKLPAIQAGNRQAGFMMVQLKQYLDATEHAVTTQENINHLRFLSKVRPLRLFSGDTLGNIF